jgi:hypothetical protein
MEDKELKKRLKKIPDVDKMPTRFTRLMSLKLNQEKMN